MTPGPLLKDGSRAQLLASMQGKQVPEGLYAGLFKGPGRGAENLWMSDTPPEVASMLPAIRAFEDLSCRRVLIGGLGLAPCSGRRSPTPTSSAWTSWSSTPR